MNVSQETLLSVLATVATVGAAFGVLRAEVTRARDEVREHRRDAKERHTEVQTELRGMHGRLAVVETMQDAHAERLDRIERGPAPTLTLARK